MSDAPQNYGNHAKFVPVWHYVGFAMILALLVWNSVRLFRNPGIDTAMSMVLLFVVIIGYLFGRIFALAAQDRIIRLEERMRMERLLEGDLKGRIMDFSTDQLIGLRFASDDELPGLAQRVLDEGIMDRKTIKQAVKKWRPDHQRV